MNLYLSSLLVFAIPANLVAGLIVWLGRKEGLKWSVMEYLFIYLAWVLPVALALFAFDGLNNAVRELDVGPVFLTAMFMIAGVLGGLSFLPRFIFFKHKLHAFLVTSISSLVLSTFFVKFVLLVFLFMS
jgi:cytochrome bd-type quinol oxidase subunit 2